jgi:hypothetical protein
MAEEKKQDPRTCKLLVRLSFTDGLKDKKAPVRDGKEKHSVNLIVVSTADDADPQSKAGRCAVRGAAEANHGLHQGSRRRSVGQAGRVQRHRRERTRSGSASARASASKTTKAKSTKATPGIGPSAAPAPVAVSVARRCGIVSSVRSAATRRATMIKKGNFFDVDDILNVCYSGCYADVIVSFYGTDEGGKGIFCSVEAIRSRQEGPQIGGGIQTSADDFDDLDGGDAFEGTSLALRRPARAAPTATSDNGYRRELSPWFISPVGGRSIPLERPPFSLSEVTMTDKPSSATSRTITSSSSPDSSASKTDQSWSGSRCPAAPRARTMKRSARESAASCCRTQSSPSTATATTFRCSGTSSAAPRTKN